MNSRFPFIFIAPLLFIGLAACGDDSTSQGEVKVSVYGEDFIEQGIPASEMADGWAVTFDKFVVTVDEVKVGGVTMPAADPVDISVPTDGGGHEVSSATVNAGSYSDSSYAITRVEVEGSAIKGADTKTFAWVFDDATEYTACETTTKVTDGGVSTFQITVHADHFFYDSLVAEEPAVVFQTLADADTDADGVISRAELEAGGLGSYDPGSAGDVDNLWTWLVAQSRTLGHVDGEGHCDSHASN